MFTLGLMIGLLIGVPMGIAGLAIVAIRSERK